MIVRLILMLALVFSTLPAPAAAAPACHDAAMAGMAGMAMAPATPAPAPEPDQPRTMGDALCIGCIAPATLRAPRVEKPRRSIAEHGVPPLVTGLHAAIDPPETPPPRG